MGPPHKGSIRRPIAPWTNALTMELDLAPGFKDACREHSLCHRQSGNSNQITSPNQVSSATTNTEADYCNHSVQGTPIARSRPIVSGLRVIGFRVNEHECALTMTILICARRNYQQGTGKYAFRLLTNVCFNRFYWTDRHAFGNNTKKTPSGCLFSIEVIY